MEFETIGRVLIARLTGEIDHHSCVQIRQEVDREYQKNRSKDLIFNFDDVSFMDSSGIGMIMGRYRNVVICGGSIAAYNVSKEVNRILNMAGICKLVKIYSTKQEALDALKPII